MRTTLTIDDALMREVRDVAHRRGLPLKEIVNRALQTGLRALERPLALEDSYRCPVYAMGYPPGLNLDKALLVAAELEDDETARKLRLRK